MTVLPGSFGLVSIPRGSSGNRRSRLRQRQRVGDPLDESEAADARLTAVKNADQQWPVRARPSPGWASVLGRHRSEDGNEFQMGPPALTCGTPVAIGTPMNSTSATAPSSRVSVSSTIPESTSRNRAPIHVSHVAITAAGSGWVAARGFTRELGRRR